MGIPLGRCFDTLGVLCHSEEGECTWTHSKDGVVWQFWITATIIKSALWFEAAVLILGNNKRCRELSIYKYSVFCCGRFTAVPGSIPDRLRTFNKEFLPKTLRNGGAGPQSLVSVPNIPGLHPKSVCSAYNVKVYVLLIAIHLLDGDVKPGSLIGAFKKE